MWEALDTPLAIAAMVLLPLLWGLGVEYAFELLRRRRRRATGADRKDAHT
jgi:hypothetical protein